MYQQSIKIGVPSFIKVIATLSFLVCQNAHAIWFEASGQAVIEDGNKQIARQRATQEAIKQALLFAGASVNSVQKIANGLLQDDRFEIRTGGEINRVELIDEVYSSDFVTVSIRADIFPQESQCRAADYQKRIVTGWFPLQNRQQATHGGIFTLGKELAYRLQKELNSYTQDVRIHQVVKGELEFDQGQPLEQLTVLARQTGSQFVLLGEVLDISIEQTQNATLAFWRSDKTSRNLALRLRLFDSFEGITILDENFQTHGLWPFSKFKNIDVSGNEFWSSSYGVATQRLLQKITETMQDTLKCKPAFGKVLQVANNQLTVDFGRTQGVKVGDELTLFQFNQLFDPYGTRYHQFKLHPIGVQVYRVFDATAEVRPLDGLPLANIQPNDFVARR